MIFPCCLQWLVLPSHFVILFYLLAWRIIVPLLKQSFCWILRRRWELCHLLAIPLIRKREISRTNSLWSDICSKCLRTIILPFLSFCVFLRSKNSNWAQPDGLAVHIRILLLLFLLQELWMFNLTANESLNTIKYPSLLPTSFFPKFRTKNIFYWSLFFLHSVKFYCLSFDLILGH